MVILGIETSCDETAAAVVVDGVSMLSNVVSSSVDLHIAYGGVVPEIAARSHLEVILPVIDQALLDAQKGWQDIDAIAITHGPGLGGSLLIGIMTARTLAITHSKPLIPVNHVTAHPYAAFISQSPLPNYQLQPSVPHLPLLALTVSGGHTQLVLYRSHDEIEIIGRTADDAIGEAFDKVAKLLGLPYPGGPSIAKAATTGNRNAFELPRAKMASPYDFSFSGLKTAVLRAAQHAAGKDYAFPSSGLSEVLSEAQKADMAASFQYAALSTVVEKLSRAALEYQPASIVVAGGVAANSLLRQLTHEALGPEVLFPDIKLCTDNAAMIASRAFYQPTPKSPSDIRLTLTPAPGLSA